ncbi:MAG: hypothetical protein OXP69_21460, partial [Spirochaetaceae bacterium]|nr:hypothetical protein [Spirochaetaceae bacterium]
SVYDIQRAVEDRATVPIYYESRLAKLTLDERTARAAVRVFPLSCRLATSCPPSAVLWSWEYQNIGMEIAWVCTTMPE